VATSIQPIMDVISIAATSEMPPCSFCLRVQSMDKGTYLLLSVTIILHQLSRLSLAACHDSLSMPLFQWLVTAADSTTDSGRTKKR